MTYLLANTFDITNLTWKILFEKEAFKYFTCFEHLKLRAILYHFKNKVRNWIYLNISH